MRGDQVKNFLENLWLGFIVLGALIGAIAPFVFIGYLIYLLLQ